MAMKRRDEGRRLLFLLPFPPRADAIHGGSRAMAGLIGRLSESHPVALLYLQADEDAPLDERLVRRAVYAQAVPRQRVDASPAARRAYEARLWPSLLAGKPAWVVQWTVSEYAACVRALVRDFEPDVVQAEFHTMGQYLSAVDPGAAVRVLVEHEPGTPAARERLRSRQGGGHILPYLDYLAWQRYERGVMRRADAVVTFTERDRASLAGQAGDTPVVTIPLGMDLPDQPYHAEGTEPGSLLFAGNFMHTPNIDAARRLIEKILPLIRRQHPEAVLYLVGDRLPAELARSAETAGIVVTGRVPDMAPYLDRAALVLVPLRQGGGMRVKVLEALAAGKAAIVTRLAAEGLDLADGEQAVFAESDEEIAAAAIRLLDDSRERSRLAQHAREWACAHLGWDRPAAAYEELYERLTRARGQVPA